MNARKRTKPAASAARKHPTERAPSSPEYREYEKRYILLGEERPKLAFEEFERLDDELLELLALEPDQMSDDQVVRLQELEYLLIDSE